jgi:flavin reductase (DIM6/NTAB) family NADH-FMN oxidoreductase RutF
MDNKSFFKISYGVFIAGVEYEGKLNACVVNTATQATSEPAKMLVTMLKTNLTTEMVLKKKSLSISIIGLQCPLDTISAFGLRSGRNADKFENVKYFIDANGNPYIEEGMVARFTCEVDQAIELSTHYVFILNASNAVSVSDADPMTYADYRKIKSGAMKVPDAATGEKKKVWICSVCHYVYDGEIPFEQLPDDYKCPVCGKGKEYFVLS